MTEVDEKYQKFLTVNNIISLNVNEEKIVKDLLTVSTFGIDSDLLQKMLDLKKYLCDNKINALHGNQVKFRAAIMELKYVEDDYDLIKTVFNFKKKNGN